MVNSNHFVRLANVLASSTVFCFFILFLGVFLVGHLSIYTQTQTSLKIVFPEKTGI